MLQHVLVKRIERMYRLRLVYGLHLALYGLTLAFCALTAADPLRWQSAALVLMAWLPVILLHTSIQSLYELRERSMVYQPVPVESLRQFNLPVDLYDEDGNRIERSSPETRNFLLGGQTD